MRNNNGILSSFRDFAADKKFILFYALLLLMLHLAYYQGSRLSQCQYSLFEDQEILNSAPRIHADGFIKSWAAEVKWEGRARFRPIYLFYRFGATAAFSDNIQNIHLLFYLLFIINTLLFLVWTRLLGFSPIQSFMCTLILFTGTQANIGWRLASSENLAFFFLSIGMISYLTGIKKDKFWLIAVGWLLPLLAILSKESFIFSYILFPLAFLLQPDAAMINWRKFGAYLLAAVITIGLYVLAIRLILLDPNMMKYAGATFSLQDILRIQFGMSNYHEVNWSRLWQTITFGGSYFQPYIFLMALGVLLALIYTPQKKEIALLVASAVGLLVVHKFLYLRLVLIGIYLYPAIIIFAVVIIYLLRSFVTSQKKTAIAVFTTAIIVVLFKQGLLAYTFAHNYSVQNKASLAFTNNLSSGCSADTVVIYCDPLVHPEIIYSIKARMDYLGCKQPFLYAPAELGDSTEALEIMKFNDPSFLPLLRDQFYQQFRNQVTNRQPAAGLGGHTWVIIQRPGRKPLHFKELDENKYLQTVYDAPWYYNIAVLRPVGQPGNHAQ